MYRFCTVNGNSSRVSQPALVWASAWRLPSINTQLIVRSCPILHRWYPCHVLHRNRSWRSCCLLVCMYLPYSETMLILRRSSYVVTCFFVFITAAVLAEICSALPAAGSIYLYVTIFAFRISNLCFLFYRSWAAESGGKKYGRLFGFIVAWWSCTAWTTFVASNCQAAANFLLSEITVFNLGYTTDVDDIKFRVVQWIVAECFLVIALSMNYLDPKTYKWIFKIATGIIMLDFFLNIIWLPIAVSRSYGFQSAEFVFTQTYNETGAPPAWNWMLSYFVTAGVLVGFEASGHISEETKDASLTAAKGIFSSAVASAVLGFPIVILFLFCTPDLNTLYSLGAPQPFVSLYALTLGQGGQVVMVVVCLLGLIFVCNSLFSFCSSSCLHLIRTPLLPA